MLTYANIVFIRLCVFAVQFGIELRITVIWVRKDCPVECLTYLQ